MCTSEIIGWDPATHRPPPRILGSYTRALLVSQDRRHIFVTPRCVPVDDTSCKYEKVNRWDKGTVSRKEYFVCKSEYNFIFAVCICADAFYILWVALVVVKKLWNLLRNYLIIKTIITEMLLIKLQYFFTGRYTVLHFLSTLTNSWKNPPKYTRHGRFEDHQRKFKGCGVLKWG
jgi:hypothetical protein